MQIQSVGIDLARLRSVFHRTYFDIKNGRYGFDPHATLRTRVNAPVQRR